jgi:hypothetical protein
MKSFYVILVAALIIAAGRDGHARPHPRSDAHHALTAARHSLGHHRAHAHQRARTVEKIRADDELVLRPSLMRQLQHNLTDGGYYSGPIDGHLTLRTRAALADFQREYHLRSHAGALDHATADALLGRDQVLAATARPPIL